MTERKNVVNVQDLPFEEMGNGKSIATRRKRLGLAAGGKDLGASFYRLAPGKRSFPYHFHHANEEAIFVVAGEGTLRLGEEKVAVRAGDYVALPVGPDHAHELLNTSEADLDYLCISTMQTPEIAEYPDTRKVGVMAGSAPGGDPNQRSLLAVYRRNDSVGYFDGED